MKQAPYQRLRWPRYLVAAAAMLAFAAGARAEPANTLKELGAALEICLDDSAGPAGSELTIVFSVRRDGSLLGPPRISYAKLVGDRARQREFLASAGAALARCMPLDISRQLGSAIAGRPFSIRIVIRPRTDRA